MFITFSQRHSDSPFHIYCKLCCKNIRDCSSLQEALRNLLGESVLHCLAPSNRDKLTFSEKSCVLIPVDENDTAQSQMEFSLCSDNRVFAQHLLNAINLEEGTNSRTRIHEMFASCVKFIFNEENEHITDLEMMLRGEKDLDAVLTVNVPNHDLLIMETSEDDQDDSYLSEEDHYDKLLLDDVIKVLKIDLKSLPKQISDEADLDKALIKSANAILSQNEDWRAHQVIPPQVYYNALRKEHEDRKKLAKVPTFVRRWIFCSTSLLGSRHHVVTDDTFIYVFKSKIDTNEHQDININSLKSYISRDDSKNLLLRADEPDVLTVEWIPNRTLLSLIMASKEDKYLKSGLIPFQWQPVQDSFKKKIKAISGGQLIPYKPCRFQTWDCFRFAARVVGTNESQYDVLNFAQATHVLMNACNEYTHSFTKGIDRITNPCFMRKHTSTTDNEARRQNGVKLRRRNGLLYSSMYLPSTTGCAIPTLQTNQPIPSTFSLKKVSLKDWNCTHNAENLLITQNHDHEWLAAKMSALRTTSNPKTTELSIIARAFREKGYRILHLKNKIIDYDSLRKHAEQLCLPMLFCGPVQGTEFLHIVGICPKKVPLSGIQLWLIDGGQADQRPLMFCRETIDSCFGGPGSFTRVTDAFACFPGRKLSTELLSNVNVNQHCSSFGKSVCFSIETNLPANLIEQNIVRMNFNDYQTLIKNLQ
jgi:hypothetical protein